MKSVDINCDMGESSPLYSYTIEKDIELLSYVSSINLACGFHAGDAGTMHRLVESALEKKVAVGAHPGFPDKENFGRTDMRLSPEMLYDIIIYQLGALQAFLHIYGSRLHHVKAHGALYNMAAKEALMADVICRAVSDFDDSLILYGLSGSEMIRCAELRGLKTASEVFADRTYREDGSLTPRTEKNALIDNEENAIKQALQLVEEGIVICPDGRRVTVKTDTICIHGDGAQALPFAKAISKKLREYNVTIQQPW